MRLDGVERGVGGTGEAVECQISANLFGSGSQALIDRDAGPVGDPYQSGEGGDRRARLTGTGGTDRGDQLCSSRREIVEVANGALGERGECLTVENAGVVNSTAYDRVEAYLAADGFTARTEQGGVGRRSIEALVQRGDPCGDELNLWAFQGGRPHQVAHARRRIHRDARGAEQPVRTRDHTQSPCHVCIVERLEHGYMGPDVGQPFRCFPTRGRSTGVGLR